jgi:hypothetical protein
LRIKNEFVRAAFLIEKWLFCITKDKIINNGGICMFIKDIVSNKRLSISFEVFPPKKEISLDGLYKTIEE